MSSKFTVGNFVVECVFVSLFVDHDQKIVVQLQFYYVSTAKYKSITFTT